MMNYITMVCWVYWSYILIPDADLQSTNDWHLCLKYQHFPQFVCCMYVYVVCILMPSVLWRCWLGGRKGVQSVKTLGDCGRRCPVGVAPTWTVGTSASIIFPCSIKNPQDRRWGNPACMQHSPMLRQKAECFFWYLPTRVVLEQRPLNGCCCCIMYVSLKLWNGCDDCLQIFRVAPGRLRDGLRCKKIRGSCTRSQKIDMFCILRHPVVSCGWHWAALAYCLGQQ